MFSAAALWFLRAASTRPRNSIVSQRTHPPAPGEEHHLRILVCPVSRAISNTRLTGPLYAAACLRRQGITASHATKMANVAAWNRDLHYPMGAAAVRKLHLRVGF